MRRLPLQAKTFLSPPSRLYDACRPPLGTNPRINRRALWPPFGKTQDKLRELVR